MLVLVGRVILEGCRIEHPHVGEVSAQKAAAICE